MQSDCYILFRRQPFLCGKRNIFQNGTFFNQDLVFILVKTDMFLTQPNIRSVFSTCLSESMGFQTNSQGLSLKNKNSFNTNLTHFPQSLNQKETFKVANLKISTVLKPSFEAGHFCNQLRKLMTRLPLVSTDQTLLPANCATL